MPLYYGADIMVLTNSSLVYFLAIPYRTRVAISESGSVYPYMYDDEPFFTAYNALIEIWAHRKSKVLVSRHVKISRERAQEWEDMFLRNGTLGLLKNLSAINLPSQLEKLVVLIKSARQHECAALAPKLHPAPNTPGASLETIRHICRCCGYGQRIDAQGREYFSRLQHIFSSVEAHKSQSPAYIRDEENKAKSLFDFEHDPLQRRIELFKSISECKKGRQPRPILKKFGVNSNRHRELRARYTRSEKVNINSPEALIGAVFSDGIGVVEVIQAYAPKYFRFSEIKDNIIVNVLRIIAGFPSIHDFVNSSDRSTAIGSGLSLYPQKSRFYDSLDELRFEHLGKLRNDAACQARELELIYGGAIVVCKLG